MKTAVITGGNSGIGKATAKVLAKKGYRVIIHGRDAQKTTAAVAEIQATSENKNVDSVVGDISTVAGIKRVAQGIQQKTNSIDVLVLSTGIIFSKQVITADGLDTPFVTQYLSRFGLVHLLTPQLENAGHARIVHVGAPAIKKAFIHFDNLALKNEFTMMTSMGQAMLSNHMFVQEFAKRHPDNKITMNIFHVGLAKTGVTRELNWFLRAFFNLVSKTADQACSNAVFLADSNGADFSGYFLTTPGKPEKRERIAYDAATAEKLWKVSEKLIEG